MPASRVPPYAFGFASLNGHTYEPYSAHTAPTSHSVAGATPPPDVSKQRQADPTPPFEDDHTWKRLAVASVLVGLIAAVVFYFANRHDPLSALQHEVE